MRPPGRITVRSNKLVLVRRETQQGLENRLGVLKNSGSGNGAEDNSYLLHPRATWQTFQVSNPGALPEIHSRDATRFSLFVASISSSSGVNRYLIVCASRITSGPIDSPLTRSV